MTKTLLDEQFATAAELGQRRRRWSLRYRVSEPAVESPKGTGPSDQEHKAQDRQTGAKAEALAGMSLSADDEEDEDLMESVEDFSQPGFSEFESWTQNGGQKRLQAEIDTIKRFGYDGGSSPLPILSRARTNLFNSPISSPCHVFFLGDCMTCAFPLSLLRPPIPTSDLHVATGQTKSWCCWRCRSIAWASQRSEHTACVWSQAVAYSLRQQRACQAITCLPTVLACCSALFILSLAIGESWCCRNFGSPFSSRSLES